MARWVRTLQLSLFYPLPSHSHITPPPPQPLRPQCYCAVLTLTPPLRLPSHSLRTSKRVLSADPGPSLPRPSRRSYEIGRLTRPREESDVDSTPPHPVSASGPDTGSVPQSPASTAELNSNGAMGGPDNPGEDQGGKKVVRVVRRVVRRVVPAGTQETVQPAVTESARVTSAADSVLKTRTVSADKDDISMGLTNLMGRSRTKEHRPRTRNQDRKEDTKEEVKEEEKGNVEDEEEKPAANKAEEAAAAAAPMTPLPKSNPLSPPAGFIPAPKPDPLSPPAGFIPAPKQNLLTPPPGFIPARKPSPVPPKQSPLARPPGFIPVTKTDPLAPPAGFIPKPRQVPLKKPEVLGGK
ncbi:uncharacterized protein LOC141791684 [Halichoeres trimaculatus]|uniref:uncharacterized protein LOC141791684 n=1 Tax=Halichoeres trimaculatus TaxID=147232 RepID=UPI003D9F5E9F